MFIGIAATIPDLPNLPGQGGEDITVTLDYSSSNFCADANDPTLTDASPTGGVFSYTGAGTLALNTSNGAIDISNSIPGNYTVTYTVAGVGSSNFPINITAVDDATFSYSASAFCADASNQTPTITTPGGTFTTQDITFRPFQMQFDTSGGKTITIPNTVGSSFTVDWGDTTVTTETGGTISHTYASGIPTSTVSIGAEGDTGAFTTFKFQNGGSKSDLIDIPQWGSIIWSSMQEMFYGCNNSNFTTITATDIPDLSSVTRLDSVFRDVSNLQNINNINNWDVSNVTNMGVMFYAATSFNGDISSWNVSNVTNMSVMFISAASFNQDLSSWNVSNVTNMANMFRSATSFNQDISSWNTSKVTNMDGVFYTATSFNQDLSNWDTSKVTTMSSMFRGASSFNQNLSSWNISDLAQATLMLASLNLTTENYTDTVVGWAVFVYNNVGSPSSVSWTGTTPSFDGTRTSDLASGQTYVAKYGANWPSAWTNNNAQDAFDYLTTTLSWTIN